MFCSVQRERKANECHGQRLFCPLMATCAASESEKFSCAAKAAFVSGEAAKPKGSGGLAATGEPTAQDRRGLNDAIADRRFDAHARFVVARQRQTFRNELCGDCCLCIKILLHPAKICSFAALDLGATVLL